MINETYITISRYAMVNGFPVMEQVRWAPAEEGDLRGITLPGYEGLWIWVSASNLFIEEKWFGQGITWDEKSPYWDLYNLPLRENVKLVTIEEFVKLSEQYNNQPMTDLEGLRKEQGFAVRDDADDIPEVDWNKDIPKYDNYPRPDLDEFLKKHRNDKSFK